MGTRRSTRARVTDHPDSRRTAGARASVEMSRAGTVSAVPRATSGGHERPSPVHPRTGSGRPSLGWWS